MTKSCCSDTGQMPSGEAIDVASLVEYAPESVVSRQLIKSDAGTITLFAFDKGQSLSEHSTPFDAVVQIVDGQAELIIGGRSVPVAAGQMAVMPADVPHAVNATARFKMLLTMLNAENETGGR